MSPLPRPVKTVLREPGWDDSVRLGWARLSSKRRARQRRHALASTTAALLLVGAAGTLWARQRPTEVASTAGLDRLVGQLPQARGRAPTPVSRPVVSAPAQLTEPAAPEPQPEVDVVGALLDSAREAYLAHQAARAAALLSEVAEHHPDDARACQTLYLLGRIQLERLHQNSAAAQSFTRALERAPPDELVPRLWNALQRANGDGVMIDDVDG